jgi:S-DNA-T family DNA segregation ATPase FtsK/SpoIIIE
MKNTNVEEYNIFDMLVDMAKTLLIWSWNIIIWSIKILIKILFWLGDKIYKFLCCGNEIKYVPEIEIENIEFSEKIDWNDEFINENIAIGIKDTNEIFNIDNKCNLNAHWLIAGTAGTGKSCIGRIVCYQAVIQKADLILIDFNDGIELLDFQNYSDRKVFTNKEDVNELLDELIVEHEKRIKILIEAGCKNSIQYNKKYPENKMRQQYIVVDELAELTDLTGLDKKQKELTNEIIGKLATLARKSRKSYGNLVLMTQYPTVDVINPQIKRNCGVRICGTVDSTTMESVILGTSGDAQEVSRPGEVIISTGGKERHHVQAFYLDDEIMKELLNNRFPNS